jgi:hypothetical protein
MKRGGKVEGFVRVIYISSQVNIRTLGQAKQIEVCMDTRLTHPSVPPANGARGSL